MGAQPGQTGFELAGEPPRSHDPSGLSVPIREQPGSLSPLNGDTSGVPARTLLP